MSSRNDHFEAVLKDVWRPIIFDFAKKKDNLLVTLLARVNQESDFDFIHQETQNNKTRLRMFLSRKNFKETTNLAWNGSLEIKKRKWRFSACSRSILVKLNYKHKLNSINISAASDLGACFFGAEYSTFGTSETGDGFVCPEFGEVGKVRCEYKCAEGRIQTFKKLVKQYKCKKNGQIKFKK